MIICPICEAEYEDYSDAKIYLDFAGSIIGCESCIDSKPVWKYAEEIDGEMEDNMHDLV